MAKPKLKFDWRLLVLLPLPLLWAWAAQAGWLHRVEDLLLDLRFRLRGELTAPVRVTYVDVDAVAIQTIGERPWNRGLFAEAAEALFAEGRIRAVGFDFVFSEQGYSTLVDRKAAQQGNLRLGRAARKYPGLVLAVQYTSGDARTQTGIRQFPFLRHGRADREKNDLPEMPEYPIVGMTLDQKWGTVGLIDVDTEASPGDTPRWVPLFAESTGPTFWHLSVQLAGAALGLPPDSARRAGDAVELVAPDGRVVRRIPAVDGQTIEVNWFSSWSGSDEDRHVSLADVLTAARQLKSDKPAEVDQARVFFAQFHDRVVLIGPVDPLLQDLASTPFDAEPVPKVGVYGNLLKTILAQQYLRRPPAWFLWAATLGLSGLVTGLAIRGGARTFFWKLLAVGGLAGYAGLTVVLFNRAQLVLPLAAPVGAAFTTGFFAVLKQLIDEEKQKSRIKGMFSTYLAPAVVNNLIESGREPELGGHEEVITAYFSDIQAFSTFSEKMAPAQLVELMNEYLTACTDIVQEEGGTLDKYIGDAIVAIFGAPLPRPDHAYRACVASLRVQQKLVELRTKWRGEGDKWPPVVHHLHARLGLNTGPAIIGNMGSRTRFNYTMMGDNVNLAARMESGAKLLGAYTMVTDSTRSDCERHGGDRIVFRFLDQIVVKGRSLPVGVHEVVGFRADLPAGTLDCLRLHAEAMVCYQRQDWGEAIRLFGESARLEPHQPDKAQGVESNPSLIMLERCHYLRGQPPGPGWTGVFVMKEKG